MTFLVYRVRTTIESAEVTADSMQEAKQKADESPSKCKWRFVSEATDITEVTPRGS